MQALSFGVMWLAISVMAMLLMNLALSSKWLDMKPPWWEEQAEELRQAREELACVRELRHFEKTKDAAGCRTTAERWENLNRTDASGLYSAACYRAVTAAVLKATPGADATRLAEEEADRAMTWLKQAVAAGYKNTVHVKEDEDLDVLRDRRDFKELVAGLPAGPTEKKPEP